MPHPRKRKEKKGKGLRVDVIQLKAQLLPGGSELLPPHPQNLLLPLISNSHCEVLSYHKFFPYGALNSRHSLFYPPLLLPGPPRFVNPYLFIGILPCVLELSRGDPIKLCQSGLEELLRECSFSPSQKFLQKCRNTREHSGQHRDENVPGWYLPGGIKMGGTPNLNPK